MPWSNARPAGSSKYDTPEYRAIRKRLNAELVTAGSGTCAEIVCKKTSRLLLPGMKVHVCHDATGQHVLGLGHAGCNVSDAGRRARARQTTSRLVW